MRDSSSNGKLQHYTITKYSPRTIQNNVIASVQTALNVPTDVVKLLTQRHAVVRVTRVADERVPVLGSITHDSLDKAIQY